MKIFILLDVDETAALSNMHFGLHDGRYRYNEALLQALKKHHLYDIYLFTSYTLSGIAKNLEEEPSTAVSRLKLVRYLESQGFRVHAVITLLDAGYNQGIGAYYEQIIRPYESLVLEGKNLRDEKNLKDYKEACEKETSLRLKADKALLTEKGAVYNYTVERLQESLLYPIFSFLFFDDRNACLNDVLKHNERFSYPLGTILVKPHHSVEIYSEQIAKFLKENMERVVNCTRQTLSSATIAPKSTLNLQSPFQDENRAILERELRTLSEALPGPATIPIYGMGEVCYLPLALARKILSQNEQGQDIRINVLGNNLVVRQGNIFFKRNPDFSLIEQAVYQISRLLGGGIVTPTQLLLLKMPEGMVALQASLAVPGIGLEDILRIPGALVALQKIFEAEDFFSILAQLLKGDYYEVWLKKQDNFNHELPSEAQCTLLLDVLYKLPKHCWPLELTLGNPTPAQVEKALLENKGLKGRALFPLIALIESYPNLCEGNYLGDIQHLIKTFEILNALYPNCTPQEIFEEGAHILEKFNAENLGRHVLLAFLTEPGDHKADNFIVQIKRDAKGKLQEFSIIAIDNDDAMQGVLRGKETHYPAIKSIIYRLLTGVSLVPSLRTALLAINPEIVVMDWLCSLVDYFKPYAELKAARILFPGFYDSLNLEKQLPLGFIARLMQRLQKIQALLNESPSISLDNLFSRIEPLLFAYYRDLGARFKDPLAFIMKLYERQAENSLEAVLEKSAERKSLEETGLLNSLKQVSQFQSYEENIIEILGRTTLLSSPIHQGRILWMLAYLHKRGPNPGLQGKLGEITLPTSLVAEIFALEPKGFITLLKLWPKILLQFENPSIKLPLPHPELLFYALASKERVLLIKALLALGTSPNVPRVLDKSTALHLASSFYPDCVQSLLPCSELESLDAQLKSPLDLAIEYRQSNTIKALLRAGAGKNLLLWNGIHFIEENSTTEPLLCQDLLSRNPRLAWEITLSKVSHKEATAENVYLESSQGRRYLNPDIYRQIFGCHLYVMSELKIPATRNAIVLIKGDSQYTAYFVRDREWIKEGNKLKSLLLTPPPIRVLDESGLVLMTEELRQFMKLTLEKAKLSFANAFPKDNLYGCRAVTAVSCQITSQITLSLHLKENPELPLREFLVHTLAKNLFGLITPPLALWRFSKEHTSFWRATTIKAYPVLAMPTVKGITLRDALLHHPEMIRELDLESVSAAVILAMLINPEDGRADNYMVEPYSKGRDLEGNNIVGYRLVSIDNDHAFVRPIALNRNGEEETHARSLQVKTVLFCLEQMIGSVHEKIREQILKIKPEVFLRDCLQELILEEENIKALFNEKERKEIEDNNVQLEFLFKPSIVLDIYQKLNRLQAVLHKNKEISLLELLRQVIPELGLRYATAFHKFDSPLNRFKFLTEGCFEKRTVVTKTQSQVYELSMTRTQDILEMSRDLLAEERKLKEEEATSLEMIRQRLKEVHELQLQLKAIRDELHEGKIDRFLQLPLNDYQERIINGQGAAFSGVNFGEIVSYKESSTKEMDVEKTRQKQQRVFEAMQKVRFRKLKIINYANLTDDMLSKMLRSQKGLLALEISNCPKLSDRALISVYTQCQALEKLRLAHLPLITSGINFPALRVLQVQDLPHLKEWSQQGARLARIKFIRCPLFSKLRLASSFNLRSLTLTDCSVPNSKFYESYPSLTEFSLEAISEQFIQALDKTLTEGLEKANIRPNAMPQPIIKAITEIIALWQQCALMIKPILITALKEKRFLQTFNQCSEFFKELTLSPIELRIALGELIPLLRDEDSDVLGRSTETIGKLSQTSQSLKITLAALVPLLRDKDLNVRRSATETIGRLWHTPLGAKIGLDELIPLLKDKDSFVRLSTAEAIGKLPHTPESLKIALDELIPLLRDEVSDVRRYAAWAIGKLPHTPESAKIALEILVPLLRDEESDVRRLAAEAIGKLPHTPESGKIAFDMLVGILRDEFPSVQLSAAWAIGKLPHTPESAKIALQVLIPLLKNKDLDVRKSTAEAIGKLPHTPESLRIALAAVVPLLRDKDNDFYVRRSAAETIEKLPHTPESAKMGLDGLIPLLRDEESDVRRLAAEAIGKLSHTPENAKIALEILVPLLRDKDNDFYVRSLAAEAIGKLSHSSESLKIVMEGLIPLLKDEDSFVRRLAAEVIGKLPHTPESLKTALEELIPLLRDEESDVRRLAAEAIGKLSHTPESAKTALEILIPLLKNKDSSVRWYTTEVIGKLPHTPESAKIALEILVPLLKNKDSSVRRCAVEAIGKLPHTPESAKIALEILIPLLKNKDSSVRRCAVEAIGKLPHTPESAKIALEKLVPLLSDKDSSVRRCAVEAIGKLPHTPESAKIALEKLVPLLRDEDSSVRWYATEAIGKLPHTPESAKIALEKLVPLLSDKDSYVQRSAAEALGKFPHTLETIKQIMNLFFPLLSEAESRDAALIVLTKICEISKFMTCLSTWLSSLNLKSDLKGSYESKTINFTPQFTSISASSIHSTEKRAMRFSVTSVAASSTERAATIAADTKGQKAPAKRVVFE